MNYLLIKLNRSDLIPGGSTSFISRGSVNAKISFSNTITFRNLAIIARKAVSDLTNTIESEIDRNYSLVIYDSIIVGGDACPYSAKISDVVTDSNDTLSYIKKGNPYPMEPTRPTMTDSISHGEQILLSSIKNEVLRKSRLRSNNQRVINTSIDTDAVQRDSNALELDSLLTTIPIISGVASLHTILGPLGNMSGSVHLIPSTITNYRLKETEFDKLPRYMYGSKEHNDEVGCVVCQEDYISDDILITLPCKHEFHEDCIKSWLVNTMNVCPICRAPVCANNPDGIDTVESIRYDEVMVS